MCFPLASVGAIIIWIIVAWAIVAILWTCVAFIGPRMGWPADVIAFLVKICSIIFWAIIAIALVGVVIEVIGCLIGMAPSLGLHSGVR
jgi:hypothetical protein